MGTIVDTSKSNVENLSPQTIRNVMKELSALTCDPPEGIKIYPNEEDITEIRASIEGPAGTPYAGGHFNMKLVLGKNFPQEPPKGYFLTKVFHPNVASNGEICVNTLKKDWKAELGIKHVLLTVKCLLIAPNPESALNEEAGKLLLEQYDTYFSRAKLYTEIHANTAKSSSSKAEISRKRSDNSEPASGNVKEDKKGKLMSKDKKRTLKRL